MGNLGFKEFRHISTKCNVLTLLIQIQTSYLQKTYEQLGKFEL